jgi:hypothetical protein
MSFFAPRLRLNGALSFQFQANSLRLSNLSRLGSNAYASSQRTPRILQSTDR